MVFSTLFVDTLAPNSLGFGDRTRRTTIGRYLKVLVCYLAQAKQHIPTHHFIYTLDFMLQNVWFEKYYEINRVFEAIYEI